MTGNRRESAPTSETSAVKESATNLRETIVASLPPGASYLLIVVDDDHTVADGTMPPDVLDAVLDDLRENIDSYNGESGGYAH